MYYYQHNIGDFNGATRHLSRIERSIYRDMIDLYYDTEQALTLDVAALCRKIMARTEEEKAAVLAVLDEFFHETPAGWFHDRCEEEIAEYRMKSSQASKAGKASAAARAERRLAAMGSISPTGVERRSINSSTAVERPLNGRDTDVQQEGNAIPTNQEPITNNHKPEQVKPTAPSDGETDEGKQPDFPAGDTVMPAVRAVFEYWQSVMGHPKAILDGKRMRAIRGRLKDGYTPEQLCKAVDGCKASPRHMGQNDRNTVYDDIELICRDATKVDSFIAHANKAADPRSNAAAMLGKVGATNLAAAEAWLNGSGVHHG